MLSIFEEMHCSCLCIALQNVSDSSNTNKLIKDIMLMSDTNSPIPRPVSPHLQIYRPKLTMIMSIVHRLTGIALYFGTILLAWWLIAAATGPDYFNWVNEFFGSFIGRLLLFGYTWALIHHMLGGIRHLVWDTGRGFDLPTAEMSARLVLIGSIAITVIFWVAGYISMGKL